MPELPEVETMARFLERGGRGAPSLVGFEIMNAELFWPSTLSVPEWPDFFQQIRGEKIHHIGRRGKFLIFNLDHRFLLMHMRMSGSIRVGEIITHSHHIQKHDRLIISFTNNQYLAFNDPRKFGRVWLVSDPLSVLGHLGPEPLDSELSLSSFHCRLTRHKRRLKPLLLDQKFLAGLGNIYTDESLFFANLHPCQLSNNISESQGAKLLVSIRNVLEEGIKMNGSSIDYVYRGGDYQNIFHVYQRTGQPCFVCGSPVKRLVIGQRSTHFCPTCQPI